MNELTNSAVKTDFTCSDGSNTISWYSLNDGYSHCTDGSDEFDESNPTTFTCDNGDMISFELVNDGMYFDCMGGEDEDTTICMSSPELIMTEMAMFLHHTAHISATIMLFVAIILTSTMHYPVDHGFSYGQHDICAQLSISNAGDTGWPGLNQITTVQPLPLDQLLSI